MNCLILGFAALIFSDDMGLPEVKQDILVSKFKKFVREFSCAESCLKSGAQHSGGFCSIYVFFSIF